MSPGWRWFQWLFSLGLILAVIFGFVELGRYLNYFFERMIKCL